MYVHCHDGGTLALFLSDLSHMKAALNLHTCTWGNRIHQMSEWERVPSFLPSCVHCSIIIFCIHKSLLLRCNNKLLTGVGYLRALLLHWWWHTCFVLDWSHMKALLSSYIPAHQETKCRQGSALRIILFYWKISEWETSSAIEDKELQWRKMSTISASRNKSNQKRTRRERMTDTQTSSPSLETLPTEDGIHTED
jgi:hypothetical protein